MTVVLRLGPLNADTCFAVASNLKPAAPAGTTTTSSLDRTALLQLDNECEKTGKRP